MFTTGVAVAFTVAFGATGAYALARYVQLSAERDPDRSLDGQARAVELLHLLMSLAMIAMAWGWSGGPASGSGALQIVVFGAFALVFVLLAARARGAAPVVSRSAHALMAVAMVWMVAAMPLLMGHTAGDDAADGAHAGHGGHDAGSSAMAMTVPAAPAPTWALVVNGLLALLLAAAAAYWVTRALRVSRPGPTDDHTATGDAGPSTTSAVPGEAGSVSTLAPARTTASTGVAVGPVRGALAAACHTVMSVGMAAMLLAMA